MKKFLSLSVFATMLFITSAAIAEFIDSNKVTVTPAPPPPPVVVTPAPPPLPVVVPPVEIPPTEVEAPASPDREVAVFPPPPPSIVITSGAPVYWFWDDSREVWFYYDRHRKPHYSGRHVYVDDGRHYYLYEGSWRVGHADIGRHKGWYKHKKKR